MSTMVGNKSSVRMYWIRVVDFFLSEPSEIQAVISDDPN